VSTNQQAASPLSERILDQLQRAGRRGLDDEELARRLGDGESLSPEVQEELDALQRLGLAVRWSRRWYATSATHWRVATVGVRDAGIAWLRGVGPEGKSYFVREANLKGARRGDRVLIKRLRAKAPSGESEASVSRILERRRSTLVGRIRRDRGGRHWLEPFDASAIEGSVRVEGQVPQREDVWVVVGLERQREGQLFGEVIEELGRVEEPDVDVQVVLHHHEIPDAFPEEVLREAEELPEDPVPESFAGREDLRDRVVVTIDGDSARDFDDGISIERLERGGFRLGVHIAGVSEYVLPASALDREAFRRGTSVYFPDRAVPMLPERLSNGLCSLRPGVPRLTQSVFIDFDRRGRVLEERFARTVIQSAARLTYDQVFDWLEGDDEPETDVGDPITPEVEDVLSAADDLLEILLRRRGRRGALDFDLPVHDVVLDQAGEVVSVEAQERHRAHRMIEEFMIAANEAVARRLDDLEVPALFRVHDPPTADRLAELQGVLRSLGVDTDLAELDIEESPKPLQELLDEQEDRPAAPLIKAMVLRLMQRALYSPENRGHYALASEAYCHFTSPIRRYPDLLVHRQLGRLLQGETPGEPSEVLLRSLAEQCSHTEFRAEQAERDLLKWKKMRLLEDRVGEHFQGRITGVQEFGLFVLLEEYGVDGLVPIATLRDDFYHFDSRAMRLIGEKSDRVFRLADRVEVVLIGINERHRGLDLEIVDMPAPEPRHRSSGRKGRRPGHERPSRRRGRRRGEGGRRRRRKR
jgi:ribonuclease R